MGEYLTDARYSECTQYFHSIRFECAYLDQKIDGKIGRLGFRLIASCLKPSILCYCDTIYDNIRVSNSTTKATSMPNERTVCVVARTNDGGATPQLEDYGHACRGSVGYAVHGRQIRPA
jgi:hypothetical protein